MDEVEEISTEEKLQIAQHYLLSSPPGQFLEVLSDVRKIVPSDILSDSLVNGIAKVSNTKNFKVVTNPVGLKVVLAPEGEIDPTHYFDSKSGTIFVIDHLTLATQEDSSIPSNQLSNKESLRALMQESLNGYVSRAYLNESSAAGAFVVTEDRLSVAISGEKINLKNFWSGRWTSSWVIDLADDSQVTINGDIKIHVHYFEDGNLQLQTSKTVAPITIACPPRAEADVVEQVIIFIQSEESALQSSLDDMYTNMNQETFRSMRRLMPITRTKMEWNVNSVRMVKQVRK